MVVSFAGDVAIAGQITCGVCAIIPGISNMERKKSVRAIAQNWLAQNDDQP
jgi:hypothetical protein